MLSRSLLFSKSTFARLAKKSLSINTPCLQAATDPIQKLFVDKINEYAQKSKSQGGKLFEASPEIQKQLHDEMEKLAKQYGADKQDFTKFPTFQFAEPEIESLSLKGDHSKEKVVEEVAEGQVEEEDDDDKPWFER